MLNMKNILFTQSGYLFSVKTRSANSFLDTMKSPTNTANTAVHYSHWFLDARDNKLISKPMKS